MKNYDLIVLGSGPGGYVAAIKAAQKGLSTAIIEKESIGGVCLNWGCIPTKTLLKSAKLYTTIQHAKDYALTVDQDTLSVDFNALLKRKNKIVKKLTGGVGYLLKKNGVTVYRGFGEVIDQNTIQVNDEKLTFKNLIIATGASPIIPPIDKLQEAYQSGRVVTSKEILDLDTQPKKLAIIGGGVIGVEFATIYNSFGTEVTIYEREENILLGVDQEIRTLFRKKLEKDGVKIHTSTEVQAITDSGVKTALGEENADLILLSVGMKANVKGLEKLDLTLTETQAIQTDQYMKTNLENIFAIGDVNGNQMLAHVASKEGLVAVDTILGEDHPMDYKKVPSGIYTFPEIAQVGVTEEEAKAQGIDYKVSTFPLSANGKALAEGETDGLVKMIADTKYQEIIGVHILAQNATEMISEAVLGMNLEATALDYVLSIHPHPTLSEMIHEVAHGIVDKAIHI